MMEGLRAWSILIPRIEEVLSHDLRDEYKVYLIKKIIEQERERDDDANCTKGEQDGD